MGGEHYSLHSPPNKENTRGAGGGGGVQKFLGGRNVKFFFTVKVSRFVTKVLVRIRFFFSLRVYCCFSKIMFLSNFFLFSVFFSEEIYRVFLVEISLLKEHE